MTLKSVKSEGAPAVLRPFFQKSEGCPGPLGPPLQTPMVPVPPFLPFRHSSLSLSPDAPYFLPHQFPPLPFLCPLSSLPTPFHSHLFPFLLPRLRGIPVSCWRFMELFIPEYRQSDTH